MSEIDPGSVPPAHKPVHHHKEVPPVEVVAPSAGARRILASMLMPDERLVNMAVISGGIYWKSIAVFTLSVLMLFIAFRLGIYLMIVAGVMFLLAYSTKYFLLLAATNKRIIMRYGILNLDVIQLRYSKIESVELAWSPLGQLLGYASVVITGTGSRVTVIPFIKNALEFRQGMNAELLARESTPNDIDE